MKKIMALLLVASFLFTLTACNKRNISENTNTENLHMVSEKIKTFTMDVPFCLTVKNNIITAVGYSITEEDEINPFGSHNTIFTTKTMNFDADGKFINEVEFKINDEFYAPQSAGIDNDGNIWFLRNFVEYNNSEATSSELQLHCFDSNGTLLKQLNLGSYGYEFYSMHTTVIVGNDGYIYISENNPINNDNYLLVFDMNGNKICEFSGDGSTEILGITELKNGTVIVNQLTKTLDKTSYALLEIDVPNHSYGKKYDVENSDTVSFYSTGSDKYYLIECTQTGINWYTLETGKRNQLLKWDDVDIYNSDKDMYKHSVILNDNIYCLTYENLNADYQDSTMNLVKLYQTTEETAVKKDEKKTVNIAALYLNDDIKSAIVNFNKENKKYRIEYKNFMNSMDDYDNAVNELNIAVTSGKNYDIYFLNGLHVQNYSEKGLFADLYEFMDNESRIKRDDYVQNILALTETDGKLYYTAPSFQINTLVAKTSAVGHGTHWTYDDFDKFVLQKKNTSFPIYNEYQPMTKQSYL